MLPTFWPCAPTPMRSRRLTTSLISAAVLWFFAPATGSLQSESVIYHDMAAIEKAPYGAFPELRTVVTDTSTIAIAMLAPKWHQTLHHHEQEQISLDLAGVLGFSLGGVSHQLSVNGAVLPPSNVEHGMSNEIDQPTIVLEYQPVRRLDLLPPHPPLVPLPQSPTPLPLPADRQVMIDFALASTGWQVDKSGARTKTLSGQTLRATFCDLSKAGASLDVTSRPSSRERLVFVLDGEVSSRVASAQRRVSREMLIEVRPSARDVQVTSRGSGPALVAMFEYIAR